MRRFWWGSLALTALLTLSMALTTSSRVGFALWHYTLAFVATFLLSAALWPLLRSRRITTLLMAFSGIPAVATGFAMLYTKQFPLKEWVTWWHSVTSFALVLAFLVHWFHNHARLNEFTRRLLTRDRRAGLPAAAMWALALGVGAFTWAPGWRERFTSENYLLLASWAVLVAITFTYGLWLVFRWPRLHERLREPRFRNLSRSLVDTGLWLAHWLVIVTGFALVYFAEPLRAGPLKYVSKWWHTATSVAFLALVTLHIGFNARLLAAHARRVDAALRPRP